MTNLEIAPRLRGLTFNGEKGDIVVFKESIENAEVTCAADELAEKVKPGVRSVSVEGVGGFLIGEDYDDAVNGTENAQKLTGRAAVVSNKVCVVTGGAQGFGEGIVRELIANNAIVFIADMNVDGAKALAALLNEQEGRTVAFGVAVNVADEDSVKAMMDEIVLTVGGVDLFVSNAGVLKAGSVKELSLKDFKFVTDVNYVGFFICTKFVAPVMEAMNKPTGQYYTDIVTISSKSALEGSNKNGAYAGSKFGSVGLVQSFAKELVADNTKVNTVCPGNFFDGPLWSDPDRGLFVQYLNTGKVPGAETVADVKAFYEAQVPMNRGCFPKDVTQAVMYSVEQKYETGQAIPVTGGQVMLN
ncbi:SDR family NAD(P)-dependent oxidoreductase [Tichowtungia aerotolerans]|uniref:SDR family NAD(P)-dependent oxidoreductase n=1 Tax=Tichowtungia aerotolerans TaxID=2697043 RepID=A0A6P1M5U9_9BACT|nr:SDR family NAD(P)-dependent oxidoreductase [Tichowtungia aerotolerans]QHI69960.1 SDR family NAD(P)-dependent oxidoreductase [Tichowtungia aerotolerans]